MTTKEPALDKSDPENYHLVDERQQMFLNMMWNNMLTAGAMFGDGASVALLGTLCGMMVTATNFPSVTRDTIIANMDMTIASKDASKASN